MIQSLGLYEIQYSWFAWCYPFLKLWRISCLHVLCNDTSSTLSSQQQLHRLLLLLQVSLLPPVAGAPSVTVPDMWTMDKDNHFNIFFPVSYKSLDLFVSFNGTKEAISSVTSYSSSISLIKWQLEPHLWRQCCIHRQSMKFKISSFTLQTAFHKFSNFFNLPGYSLVRQTDF